jgi:hypothetical protein
MMTRTQSLTCWLMAIPVAHQVTKCSAVVRGQAVAALANARLGALHRLVPLCRVGSRLTTRAGRPRVNPSYVVIRTPGGLFSHMVPPGSSMASYW